MDTFVTYVSDKARNVHRLLQLIVTWNRFFFLRNLRYEREKESMINYNYNYWTIAMLLLVALRLLGQYYCNNILHSPEPELPMSATAAKAQGTLWTKKIACQSKITLSVRARLDEKKLH